MSWRALREATAVWLPLLVAFSYCFFQQRVLLCWLLFSLLAFVVYFFRDPNRPISTDENEIVSPADGLVDAVQKLEHIDCLGGPGWRVSIFLSVFDVHINRAPVAGRIIERRRKAGRFLDARRDDSALKNENQLWVIETPNGKVGVRQIAGLIARRIVSWKYEGDGVEKGERIGLIRFGSRTDLYLPPHAILKVEEGDKVKGAETVIARWGQDFSRQGSAPT